MDIARPDLAKKRKRKKNVYIAAAVVVALSLLAFSIFSGPAVPIVDREDLWVEEVMLGDLELNVQGYGTLESADRRWIASRTGGLVERVDVLPGAVVEENTTILVLANVELEQDLIEGQLELISAEANLNSRRVEEEDLLLNLRFTLEQLQAQYENAKLDVDVNQSLYDDGLIALRQLKGSQIIKNQLEGQLAILTDRIAGRESQMQDNLAPLVSIYEQAKARLSLLTSQVDALKVKAGKRGVLQQLNVEEGQEVGAGDQLCLIIDPNNLMAVVGIPEYEAKHVSIGQRAIVDTPTGELEAIVKRVDPRVSEGLMNVDVALIGEVDSALRSDLSVSARIIFEKMSEVVYVSRPTSIRDQGDVSMYVLDAGNQYAQLTRVELGRGSARYVEVLDGLRPGSSVILSDTTQWAGVNRVKIR